MGQRMTTSKETRYILAFGDSLTEGFHAYGRLFSPYSIKLQQLIDEYTTSKPYCYQIINKGISGETTHSMKDRIVGISKEKISYSHAIILGGTNDLGNTTAQGIAENLISIHETMRKVNTKTFAVTIPEHGQEPKLIWITEKREAVNKLLSEYCAKNNIAVVDLATKLPMHSLSEEDRKLYWDDGIHFTPKGYERFGELIFEVIKDSL